jgi:tRNA modification GTPase
MYDLNDTIAALSSADGGVRPIVRITGPQTLSICDRIFEPRRSLQIKNQKSEVKNRTILPGSVRISDELAVDARLYLFFAPHSYTGEDLAEIHLYGSAAVAEALMQRLLSAGLRPAGPGEFTARAYLNGKLDLAQAEAVNEIISGSNQLQLDAAQRLLGGRLTQEADDIRSALLDILGLIEAGLDFSTEPIEFISAQQAVQRLGDIETQLERLLTGSIRYETLMDLPAVGIAGAPNAGKSSLLNALLGWERSIVSPQPRTTRDVLTGVLITGRLQCAVFDCAGLILSPDDTLDELAQRAAVEALRSCVAVVFCVDAAKPDWTQDLAIRGLIEPKDVICVATKSDLLSPDELAGRLEALAKAFHAEFLPVSTKTSFGLQGLLDALAPSTIHNPLVTAERAVAGQSEIAPLVLVARHKQQITEAAESVRQAIDEVRRGQDEIAVTMLRAACEAISQIEQPHIGEQVLERIFSRFCIGK